MRQKNLRHERLLYLVVGGWNTIFTYGCFSLLYWLLNSTLPSPVILMLTYLVSSVNSFVCFRYIVFSPASRTAVEYLRFQVVYAPLLLLNMLVLPLALRYSSLNAYVIQALFACFSVVAGYLGNKYFTFRPPRHSEPDACSCDGSTRQGARGAARRPAN